MNYQLLNHMSTMGFANKSRSFDHKFNACSSCAACPSFRPNPPSHLAHIKSAKVDLTRCWGETNLISSNSLRSGGGNQCVVVNVWMDMLRWW